MARPYEPVEVGLLRAQARILDALATGAVLTGTLDDLGQQFGLPAHDLRTCVCELVRVQWIAAQTHPDGRVTIRIERRSLGPRPVASDRRSATADAWPL